MKKKKNIQAIERSYFSPRGFTELQWYVVVVLVLAALLLGWTSMMSMLGFNISLSNILYLHNFLFTWIFDILVLGIVVIALYVTNFKANKLNAL